MAAGDGQEELERENSLLRSVLREARGGLGDCSKQAGAVLRAAARSRQGRDKCDRQVHAAWLIPFIACPIKIILSVKAVDSWHLVVTK